MKLETLRGRKAALARFRIIFIHSAQRLQNLTAWFREVRGDFHELPASVRQAVGQQDLGAVVKLGSIPRQRIAPLERRGEFARAMIEHVAQIFTGVRAAREVQRKRRLRLCGVGGPQIELGWVCGSPSKFCRRGCA